MDLYRITEHKFIRDISGTGAFMHGGRYNHKGYYVLYLAESIALAAWEKAVYLDFANLPDNLSVATITVPDDWVVANPQDYLKRQEHQPGYEREIGRIWLEENTKPLLKVPSVVISGNFNMVINVCNHNFRKRIKVKDVQPFVYDESLVRS